MTSLDELDVYEVAYLCGGPHRVALVAVAAMAQDGRIKISRALHRVHVEHHRAGQPVEQAVLDAVPASGTVLEPLLDEVAHSAAVDELTEGLRRSGLAGHHSLVGHPRLSAAGRAARKELESSGTVLPAERSVAVLGTAGITNAGLRNIFEAPAPPPGSDLIHTTGKDEKPGKPGISPIPGISPDTDMPMRPGISEHW